MDELAARVSAALGVDAEVSRTAIGLVLGFLERSCPTAPSPNYSTSFPARARRSSCRNPPAAGVVSQD